MQKAQRTKDIEKAKADERFRKEQAVLLSHIHCSDCGRRSAPTVSGFTECCDARSCDGAGGCGFCYERGQ